MNTYKQNESGGFFVSGLQLLFIYLKLTNHINWSWFWVLSPLWIGLVLVVIVTIIMVIIHYMKPPKLKIVGDRV